MGKTDKGETKKAEPLQAKADRENISEVVGDISEISANNLNDKVSVTISSDLKEKSDIKKSTDDSEFDKLFNTMTPKEQTESKSNGDEVNKLISESESDFDKLLANSDKNLKSSEKTNEKKTEQHLERSISINENNSETSSSYIAKKVSDVSQITIENGKESKVEKCKNLEDVIGELEKKKKNKNQRPQLKKLDEVLKCVNCSFQSSFYNSLVRHSRLKHFSTTQQAEEFVCPAKS